MADKGNNVNINVNVTDNKTLDKLVTKSEALKGNLQAAAKASARTASPIEMAKGTRAYASISRRGDKDTEASSLARSIGAGTGAAGRDFSTQARGLGGLVHVYATFAANLFAVSAAFNALSKAADITNLVKGLDQLGAASGRNLGSVAKDLVRVTKGALSFQDALRTTAQASAGGITNANILRMGDIARTAAQALGRSMPDAMDRLTRGITKLEPELLDEIGIMVRLDDATKKYAASVGKTASSLTDFERRQAFANAVMEQGEKKFGAIKLDANPYSKLLADVQNLTLAFGELINKALSPVLNILNSSPTALAAALVGIGTVLIKQAIPALSMWQAKVKEVAKADEKAAREALENRLKMAAARREASIEEDVTGTVSKFYKSQKDRQKAVTELASLDKLSAKTKKLIIGLDKEEIVASDATVRALEKQAEARRTLVGIGSRATPEVVARAKAEAAAIDNVVAKLRQQIAATKELHLLESEQPSRLGKIKEALTEEAAVARVLQKQQARSNRSAVIDTALGDAAALGTLGSIKKAWKDVGERIEGTGKHAADAAGRMSKLNGIMAGIGATAAVGARGLGLLLSSLTSVFFYIGLLAGAIALFDNWMSTSGKQAEKFSSNMDTLDSSLDNVSRTLDVIKNKDFDEIISIDSIQARANAFVDLSDSISAAVDSFEKLRKAQSGWDRAKDWVLDLFGAGTSDKLVEGLSKSIVSSLETATTGTVKDKVQKLLADLLGQNIDVRNIKSVEKALESLSDEKRANVAASIAAGLKEISREAGVSASRLTSLKDTLDNITKLFGQQTGKLLPTDEFTKIGEAAISVAVNLNQAFEDTTESLAAFKAIADNLATVALFSPDTSNQIINLRNNIKDLEADQARYNNTISIAKKELEKVTTELGHISDIAAQTGSAAALPEGLVRQQAALQVSIKELENFGSKVAETISDKIKEAFEFGNELLTIGMDKVTKGLQRAVESASINISKNISSIISSTGGATSALDLDIAKREIELRRSALQAMYENTLALHRLTISISQAEAGKQVDKLEKALKDSIGTDKETKAAEDLNKAQITYHGLSEALDAVLSKNQSKVMSFFKDINKTGAGATEANKVAYGALAPVWMAIIGKTTQEQELRSATLIAETNAAVKAVLEETKQNQRAIDDRIKELQLEVQGKKLARQTAGPLAVQEAIDATASEENVKSLQVAKDRLEIESQIQVASLAVAAASDAAARAQATENLVRLQQLKQEYEERDKIAQKVKLMEGIVARHNIAQEELNALAKQYSDTQALSLERLKLAQEESNTTLTVLGKTLGEDSKLFDLAKAHESLEILREENKIRMVSAEYEYARARIQANMRIATLAAWREVGELSQESFDKAVESEELALKAARLALETSNKQVRNSEAIAAAEEKRAKAAYFTDKVANGIAGISTLFGNSADEAERLKNNIVGFGDALYKAYETYMLFSDANNAFDQKIRESKEKELQYQENINALHDEGLDNKQAYDREAQKLAEQRVKTASLENAKTTTQVQSILALTAATKRFFNEKSRGYKTISNIEKGIHLASMAMQAVQAAQSLKTMAIDVAGGVAKLFKQGGWLGFAGAAAFIALMASLGFGKKGGSKGPSVEARQDVQGTGRRFDESGNLVNRAGAALGDVTAKSKSIGEGIELIEKHSFSTMEYSNDMLKQLKAIRTNTQGLTAILMQAGYNVLPGDNGVLSRTPSRYATNYWEAMRSGDNTSSWYTPGRSMATMPTLGEVLFGSNSGLGRAAARLRSRVWGGETTATVQDQGIRATGQLSSILNDPEAFFEAFQTVNVHRSGGWFGRSRDWQETIAGELDARATNMFDGVLTGMYEATLAAAGALGKDPTLAKILTDSFQVIFDVSLQGLKPEEAAQAIEAELSSVFNELAIRVVPEISDFIKAGEEAGTAIIRLARDIQLTQFAFESAGLSIANNTGSITANLQITESLLEASDGLDKFLERIGYFRENFLTEAERLAPVQARVTAELTRLDEAYKALGLNIKDVNTREEFANIIRALDVTTDAGRSLYVEMMNLAEGFATVYQETRKIATAEELRKITLQQLVQILKLEGKVSDSIALSRQVELDAMDESLRDRQKYIWLLEDRLRLLGDEKDVLSAAGYAYEALIITRQAELRGLTDEEAAIRRNLYYQQDIQKTRDLNVKLLQAQNKSEEALVITRQEELKALSSTDAAIQSEIWRLEDLNKLLSTRKNQEQQIYELLGESEAALAIVRADELESLDDRLKASQLYIYSLQDEKTLKDKLEEAYNNESSSIQEVIDNTKQFIETLKDFKQSLLVGDLTTLNPVEQYNKTKEEAMRVAAIATGIATTDAEKQAKEDALNKLPDVTGRFLEASRTIFASSGAYESDFNYILSILDNTIGGLESQKTDAEKQLDALTSVKDKLEELKGTAETANDILAKLLIAQETTAVTMVNAAVSGSVAAGGTFTGFDIPAIVKGIMDPISQTIFDGIVFSLSDPALGIGQGPLDMGSLIQVSNDNTNALVDELQKIREQLVIINEVKLNDLIGTNITVTRESAEIISNTVKTIQPVDLSRPITYV